MITILFIHYYNSLMIFGQKKTRKYLLPGYSNMISQLAVWTGQSSFEYPLLHRKIA